MYFVVNHDASLFLFSADEAQVKEVTSFLQMNYDEQKNLLTAYLSTLQVNCLKCFDMGLKEVVQSVNVIKERKERGRNTSKLESQLVHSGYSFKEHMEDWLNKCFFNKPNALLEHVGTRVDFSEDFSTVGNELMIHQATSLVHQCITYHIDAVQGRQKHTVHRFCHRFRDFVHYLYTVPYSLFDTSRCWRVVKPCFPSCGLYSAAECRVEH